MVASGSPRAAEAAVFDLDEDVTTEPVVDPVVDPVATFDLDEERRDDVGVTVRRVAAPDVPPEVMVFDLDEDDADMIVLDVADAEARAESAAEMEADALAAAMMIQLDEGDEESSLVDTEPADDDDRSLWEPPDDISTDDLREAQRDQQHTRLMGQYMTSRGVIP